MTAFLAPMKPSAASPASLGTATFCTRKRRNILIIAGIMWNIALGNLFVYNSMIEREKNTTKRHLTSVDHRPQIDASSEITTASAQAIKEILLEEVKSVDAAHKPEEDLIEKLANLYELVYAFIAEFQKNNIPIFVGFGSHLGARRHHGIIPFGEKDVDFQVFCLNETKVISTIKDTLAKKSAWSKIEITDPKMKFGYQLMENGNGMAESNMSHYIDFWLFDQHFDGNKISCVGRNNNGCKWWFRRYHMRDPPVFAREDYFPPLYQVFGSHKVPIPATSAELETSQYASESWNTTCGAHKRWKNLWWEKIPQKDRVCSNRYKEYPFVFSLDDGQEQLRQGSTIIHESHLG